MKEERDPENPYLLMYLHKATHRGWLPAQGHCKQFTQKQFPLPKTLFDDYENRGTAAKTAKMNILKDKILTNDNKIKDSVVK